MKSKIFGLMIFSILAMVAMLGMASAVINYESTGSTIERTIEEGTSSVDFLVNISASDADQTVNNWEMESFNSDNSGLSTSDISFNFPSQQTIPITESNLFTITLNNIDSDFVGETVFTINVSADPSSTDAQVDLTLTVNPSTELTTSEICLFDDGVAEDNDLEVNIDSIEVIRGFGEDEEWVAFDEVEFEIEVDNSHNEDIDDISLEWGIVGNDLDGEWVVEFDEIEEFDLKDGDDEIFTITFKVDESDLDMDLDEFVGGDYNIVVRATGEIDDDDNTPTCAAASEEVSVDDGESLILNNFQFDGIELNEDNVYPEGLSCGTNIQITADLWNIADSEEDDLRIRVFDNELGINEYVGIGNVLGNSGTSGDVEEFEVGEFDSEPISFSLTIPEGIERKLYSLQFMVYQDNDIFENDYVGDDEEAVFNVFFNVDDCVTAQAQVSASLEAEAKAGKDLVVKTTITNPGNKESTYTLNAAGYSSWASAATVEPQTLTLGEGESAEVLVTFNTLKTASGNNLFNLEVLSEDELVTSQQIQVPVKKSLAGTFEENTGVAILVVAIIILILTILIVFLIKALRK